MHVVGQQAPSSLKYDQSTVAMVEILDMRKKTYQERVQFLEFAIFIQTTIVQ
jgi:hypothetical protein